MLKPNAAPAVTVRVTRGADAHKGTLRIGDWSVPCVIGAGGLVDAAQKREGDRCTPIGVFPLRYGLFDPTVQPSPVAGSAFPFVPMDEAMLWEEDPLSPDYNRLLFDDGGLRKDKRMVRRQTEGLFDLVVPIGYNDAAAEPFRGSAIFIHAARTDMSATAGCVAVKRTDLPELARRLVPGMVIDIGHADEAVKAAPGNGDFSPFEIVQFKGMQPGPKLLVLGAVHGNEVCGPQAIRRAIAECQARRIVIARGQVTFVPVVNLKAYLKNERIGDRNLNRDLRETIVPQDNEDRIANLLCPLLREHDVLLDLHSFKSTGEPFVFAGPSNNNGSIEPFTHEAEETAFASILGLELVMHGWLDTYVRGVPDRASLGVGTTEYMRFSGGYGVTVECGNHLDPDAENVGYAAILNALAHLGLIAAPVPRRSVTRGIELVSVTLAKHSGDMLAQTWRTGDEVKAGTVIARRHDGSTLTTPADGYIVFPNSSPQPGETLYYLGINSQRFGTRKN